MLIGWQGRTFVGLGSDHTDRKVETYSVTVSKQMCDMPVAAELWELEDVIDLWDRMVLRAYAWIKGERVLYQEGTLDAMLPVKQLIEGLFGTSGLPDGCAISLPAHREGEVPVGLMLAAAGGSDRRIFELAAGMEGAIRV